MKKHLINLIVKPKMVWLASLFFILMFTVRLWGLNSSGNVWDEYFYYNASRDFAHNIVLRDSNSKHWDSNYEHPPLGKYVYMPAVAWNKVHHVSDRDAYHAPRVISALIGSLSVVLVLLLGARHFSRHVGVMAAIFYGFIPIVMAYHKIINLDVTLTFFYIASMYFLLNWIENRQNKDAWWSALFACLAFASKFNAIFIVVIYLGILMIDQGKAIFRSQTLKVPLAFLLFIPGMFLVLTAMWPWLWDNTLDHFTRTLLHWGGGISELFLGHYGPTPVTYFFVHFLFETPILILIFLAIGIWYMKRQNQLKQWTLLLWFLAPFLLSFYHLRQDNLRYMMPAMPAVALIASLGFWQATQMLQGARKGISTLLCIILPFTFAVYYITQHFHGSMRLIYFVTIAGVGILVWLYIHSYNLIIRILPLFSAILVTLYLITVVVVFHPYYLNYFNILIGGPQYVQRHHLFRLGYYGEGIKEATEYVNNTASDGATVHYEIIPDDAPYLDRPRLVRYDYDGADYLIFNSNLLENSKRASTLSTANYQVVHTVSVNGAPFVWVYKIRPEFKK